MGRAPCCDKANVKKGPWSPEEDAKLRAFIEQNGTGGNWITLPMKAGLKRCGKSCRLRWINYLRPGIKRGGFSEEEEKLIYKLHASFGSRWSLIAAQLPGRTDNDIKNYWNTRLKRKLCDKEEISCPKEIEPQDILPLSCNSMPDLQSSSELPVEELLLRIENSLQSCISAPSPGESSCSRTSTDRSPPHSHSHCHFNPEIPGDFFPPTYNSITGDQQYRPLFQRMPPVDVTDCFGRNLNVKEESGLFESNWWASFSLPPSNGWNSRAWPNRI